MVSIGHLTGRVALELFAESGGRSGFQVSRPIRYGRKAEWIVTERFERHRQPWTAEELQKLRLLAGKGMALKAIARAMTRSEEPIKDRAKLNGIGIAKLR